MNITELDQFRLSDAVKFNDKLNPRLWDDNEKMRPEVRQALLRIAEDFREFLGVDDLQLKDITVSGSNAAYTYTPHSDIDLHLVVDLPEADRSQVYRELFDAKKYQYNDIHNIKIGGYDVELYVENANEKPVSQGIYSVKNDEWVDVPKRRRAEVDDVSTRNKYQDLLHRIESAIESKDADILANLMRKIREMRQAGLDAHGEFGPENLAFKMLRSQGWIKKLADARNAAQDREMSLDERKKKKKRVRYGWGSYWYPGTAYAGQDHPAGSEGGDSGGESVKESAEPVSIDRIVGEFVQQMQQELKIKKLPTIKLRKDPEWSKINSSFGRYDPDTNTLYLAVAGRHIMDVLRTLSHELVHRMQAEREDIPDWGGATGSRFEDEANAMAGRIMRHMADSHPEYFADIELTENASGYIPKNKKEAQDPRYSMAVTVDIKPGQVGKEANKLGLQTGRNGEPGLLMKSANLLKEFKEFGKQTSRNNPDLNDPLGPETPPTMPAGTVKVDVSDMYDWYKLGQHISNMKGLGRHDFGAGPPSTIISFGDEDTEHKYIKDLEATGLTTTDVDPKDPKQPPGMPRQKTDPTYNVSEAFDQPYPIQWEESDYGDVDALAKLDDGSYLSIMFNNSGLDSWNVEFHRNNSQEVTGEGDASKVFATVLTAIQQFIQEHNPHIVYFSAVKDQDPKGSRAKLYDRLVQRYASQLGYSVKRTTRDDEVGYNLVRIRQNVTENDTVESLRREFSLLEDEYISEIRMSTANLRQEAAKTGARAGMEFEMIVPDAEGEPPEPEYERDDDADRRARSFDDVEEFFYDRDYNSRGDVRSLLNELGEAYQEWKMDRTASDWDDEGLDYLRDYIENNDLFDRNEALDTARDEFADANPDIPLDSEEAQRGISARVAELEEQFVRDEFESQGRIYNDAFTEFADEKNQDYNESDFLEEAFPYMSDIERNFDIQWPYYYDINDGDRGEASVDDVANEFEEAIGRPVNASSSYHGARREPGHYVVEPDGSLEGDEPGDAGLEFVSPPLPIDELLSDLNKVKEWAGRRGCYTNDSTGLHINISVPDYSLDKLDYVKLALLMGDEYVLDLFGRSGNHYAKAATGKIRTALQKDPDLAPALLDKMRGHMEDLATKAIHSGITDKYTSINTKSGYIEFRSPGGDWLDANFDKIENTLLRFTVALSAAINPQAYRKEYLKKLYKLLEGAQDKGGVDVIELFSNYSAGELDKAALIRQVREKQLARNLAKGNIPAGQKYWWKVTNPANTAASIEVVAASKEEAIAKTLEPKNYPEWARVQNTLRATPLRPYQEPQAPNQTGNWGIWMQGPGRFARAPGQIDNSVLRRFPSREAAEQWIAQTRSTNTAMRTDIEVREIEPTTAQPQQGSGAYTYRVFTTDNNQTVGTFQADGIHGSTNANTAFRDYLLSIGRDSVAGFNYEQIGRERQQPEFVDTATEFGRGDLTPRGPGPWEIYRISDNQAVRPLEHTSRPAAESEARSALGLRGWDPTEYGVRTRQQQPQPLGAGREFVGWKIVDSQGRTIHEFSGIGNAQSDANAFAINWLRRNPQHMQAGVEVVPNWREA